MGQCMVVRAVFSPGRGDVYDVSQVGSIAKDGSTDVGGIGSGVDPTTGVAPQTVFEYLTPKSLIYLIHRGRYCSIDPHRTSSNACPCISTLSNRLGHVGFQVASAAVSDF
jgi:hypothetical protein